MKARQKNLISICKEKQERQRVYDKGRSDRQTHRQTNTLANRYPNNFFPFPTADAKPNLNSAANSNRFDGQIWHFLSSIQQRSRSISCKIHHFHSCFL